MWILNMQTTNILKSYWVRKSLTSKGFTLIELLVVMAVIAGMAAIVIFQFPGVPKAGRDTQRKNDLRQYQTAIEKYANSQNNLYPDYAAQTQADSLCTTLGLGSTCAKDPLDGQTKCSGQLCRYYYISNVSRTSYVLWSISEKPASSTKIYWTVCSNGVSGESSTVSTNGTCPI